VRARHVLLAMALSAQVVALTACGSTSPTGSSAEETVWIHGYYLNMTTSPRLTWPTCVVDARLGDAEGDEVEDLSVMCNGQNLPFDLGVYSADIAVVPPGGGVAFEVSGIGSSLAASLVVPEGPSGVELAEGDWDFSSPSGTHTLSWDNPGTVADSLVVVIVGEGPHSWNIVSYSEVLPASAESLTVVNSQLPPFDLSYRIEVGVFQANVTEFAGYAGDSKLWARCGPVATWNR